MFLLQHTILSCLLTTAQQFATTQYIGSNRKPTEIFGDGIKRRRHVQDDTKDKSTATNTISKDPLVFDLIGHVNGVSVHNLRTILLPKVRDAGLEEDTAIVDDMEDLRKSKNGTISSKGAQHTITSNTTAECTAGIVISAEQKKAMLDFNLLNALAKNKIENAVTLREEGKTKIASLVEKSVGHAELNINMNSSTRKSIIKGEEQLTAERSRDTSTELEYAKLCDISVFLGLDDLTDALQILNQGLAINEKVFGKEHPATAACYNNIGAVMKAMGDNYDALQMLNQGLATFEKVYGKEHPATATSYANIGSVMEAMGNNVGALEMYNQGLAIRENVYGKEHPDTAESYNNIGLLMIAMGNNAGALKMLNQGLAINEKVYGKDHPTTAACYNNIGAVMKAMGDNFNAVEMLNQGLATFEKVYGKEHPATATAYTNIGSVMEAMGNNVGALEMYNQGLAIREKVLGKEHPDTAESYNNIGLLYQAMGNNVGALEMYNQGREKMRAIILMHLKCSTTALPFVRKFLVRNILILYCYVLQQYWDWVSDVRHV